VSEVVQTAKHFVIAVSDQDGAQSQAHEKKGKRLQTIEIGQSVPPEREQ
jgi:hypothetical protein